MAVDFGSTYTKVALFDLDDAKLIGSAYTPSSVETDVNVGLQVALEELTSACGIAPQRTGTPAVACSSAAGGLKVVVIGLVPSLSLEAARRAALGAGAKITGAFGHKLIASDLAGIVAGRPDIVLLAGGTDGGDETTITANAALLAVDGPHCPLIVAGNRNATAMCVETLKRGGKTVFEAPNILPQIDRLDVNPVHNVIRDLFMHHITRAKGIDRARSVLRLEDEIVPTPRAILEAAELLCSGPQRDGLGELVVVDIGGATTDVHSVASGVPTGSRIIKGLPEPYAKRTVEGDLGLRVNAPTIYERVGEQALRDYMKRTASGAVDGFSIGLAAYCEFLSVHPAYAPTNAHEKSIDLALARAAASIAMQRHAGAVHDVMTASGPVAVQEGKDLSNVATVIGVGGVLAHGDDPAFVLNGTLTGIAAPTSLGPTAARFYVDRSYVLFGVGLLAKRFPGEAFRIAMNYLTPI